MQIIGSDEPFGDMETTALGINWGIRRCNIEGCTETSLRVIVTGSPAGKPFGMCKKHYDEATEKPGNFMVHLDFTPLEQEPRP